MGQHSWALCMEKQQKLDVAEGGEETAQAEEQGWRPQISRERTDIPAGLDAKDFLIPGSWLQSSV